MRRFSILAYRDFEANPDPALATCVKFNMRSRQIVFFDYPRSENPLVLHRRNLGVGSETAGGSSAAGHRSHVRNTGHTEGVEADSSGNFERTPHAELMQR
jgi:hypothetical protein